MGSSKFEVDIVMKSSAEKVWKNVRDFATTFPKALPNTFQNIEIILGDGKSVGTVFKSTLKPELEGAVSKERIDAIDDEKKIMSYSFLEGDILKYYKYFNATVSVTEQEQDDGSCSCSCVVKYSAEFEKENQQIPDPILYRDFAVKLYNDFDAYLINA